MADIVLMRGHKINKKRVVTTKRVSKWSEWLTSCKMAWSGLVGSGLRCITSQSNQSCTKVISIT